MKELKGELVKFGSPNNSSMKLEQENDQGG